MVEISFNGITYKEDCLIGANNAIERLLCGNSASETLINYAVFIILIIGVLILVYYAIKKFQKKR